MDIITRWSLVFSTFLYQFYVAMESDHPLLKAIYANCPSNELRYLILKNQTILDAADKHGFNCLHHSILAGNSEAVYILIARGVLLKEAHPRIPYLHLACRYGRLSMLNILLREAPELATIVIQLHSQQFKNFISVTESQCLSILNRYLHNVEHTSLDAKSVQTLSVVEKSPCSRRTSHSEGETHKTTPTRTHGDEYQTCSHIESGRSNSEGLCTGMHPVQAGADTLSENEESKLDLDDSKQLKQSTCRTTCKTVLECDIMSSDQLLQDTSHVVDSYFESFTSRTDSPPNCDDICSGEHASGDEVLLENRRYPDKNLYGDHWTTIIAASEDLVYTGLRALDVSAAFGHISCVQRLLKSQVPGEGLLERAVSECCNGAVALLLRSYDDDMLSENAGDMNRALKAALTRKLWRCVDLLLQYGARIAPVSNNFKNIEF